MNVELYEHGELIRLIDNPTEEQQLIAVINDSSNIRWIKNPTENVCLKAVEDGSPILK